VSLAPHLTEIVFALGAGDRLVGVSEASDFPPEARRLPRVGGVAPDLELIVSLSPDLVLASREDNPAGALASLSRLGVPVLATETPDLPAIAGNVRSIGERLGAGDRGRKLARDLERRLALVRPPPGRHLSAVILVWADPPQAAGRGTFADDLLRRAGASNIVTRPGWPVVSAEFLVSADCDAVIFPEQPETRAAFERAFQSGAISGMNAVRAGRTIGIDADLLARPGPRAFDALERLARRLAGLPR
jgi:iron complex transport system substrate-binding protein